MAWKLGCVVSTMLPPFEGAGVGWPLLFLSEVFMVVVYSATRNYYKYLQTTIKSLFAHNDPKVYVLAEDDDAPFPNVINVSGMKPKSVNADTVFSYMSLLRVQLADIVSEDKVIYLDVDTVVCDDISPMWEVDMTGKWWGAVKEKQTWYRPFGNDYYNNGVSIYNLKQMREDGIVPYLTKEMMVKVHPFPDQDVMNMYCVPDKVVPLPMRYNESACCGMTINPAIVHFAGIPNWYNNPYILRSEYLAKYL